MKKYLFLILCAISTFVVSCSPNDETTLILTLHSPSLIEFEENGGEGSISFHLEAPNGEQVTATSNQNWINNIKLQNNNQITFNVAKNESSENREAEITARCSTQHFVVKVVQEGKQIQNKEEEGSEITIGEIKPDNPLIYASGGSLTIPIFSEDYWNINIIEPQDCNWLTYTTTDNSVTFTTNKNYEPNDREVTISISNGSNSKEIVIKQHKDIIRRQQINQRRVFNQLNLIYDNNYISKLYVFLPTPTSNIYQDIEELTTSNGSSISTAHDQTTKYLWRVINNNDIKQSGECILKEEFLVTNYSINVDFNAINSFIEIDKTSEIFKKYTKKNGDIIDPELKELQPIADSLWESADSDIIQYAYLCYIYVAENMKYLNPNTGLHPLSKILTDGGGDCGNQASVFISLLRNKEIPSRHVVMMRPDNTFHIRAEFFIAGYGWIPVDPNGKNLNPDGDYFGKVYSDEIVLNNEINISIDKPDNTTETIELFQTFLYWYWITNDMTLKIVRKTGTI